MRWIHALKLPPEITEFERRYLQRANRGTLAFFAAHIPVITLIAFSNGTGAALARRDHLRGLALDLGLDG